MQVKLFEPHSLLGSQHPKACPFQKGLLAVVLHDFQYFDVPTQVRMQFYEILNQVIWRNSFQ